MAYSLVVDTSNFRPFDYSLMLAALKDYNANYEKQLAVYDKIALTMGDLASAVEGSDQAKKIYDNYLSRFNAAADAFSRGMNPDTARELGALRNIYGTLIRPLERANEARAKAAEYLRTLNKDGLYMHEELGTLDDWMNNPNRLIRGYSGTLLTNEVGALTKAASNDIVNMINAGHLDPYTKKFLKTRGFSSKDVDKVISYVKEGGIDSIPDDGMNLSIMKNILKSAMGASGIYNWADSATRRNAENIAARGLYQGVGQADITTVKDDAAIKLLELNAQINLERAKALEKLKLSLLGNLTGNLGNSTGNELLSGTIPINTKNIISPAYDLKNYQDVLNSSLSNLGLSKDSKGDYTLKKVKVNTALNNDYGGFGPLYVPGGVAPIQENKKEFNVFYSNGKMMTRHQFISLGAEDLERRALSKYYDNILTPSLFNIGIDLKQLNKEGKSPTKKGIIDAYTNSIKDTGSLEATFIPFVLNDTKDRAILDRFITELYKEGEDRFPAGTIMEVQGWNKNGALNLGRPASKTELEAEGTPLFYSHIGDAPTKEHPERSDLAKHLIFRKGNKIYAIPKSKLGSIVNDSYAIGDLYATLLQNKDRYIRAKMNELTLIALLVGVPLTYEQLYNKAYENWKLAIDNIGAAYARSFGTALDLEYNSPAFNYTEKSNSANP